MMVAPRKFDDPHTQLKLFVPAIWSDKLQDRQLFSGVKSCTLLRVGHGRREIQVLNAQVPLVTNCSTSRLGRIVDRCLSLSD